MNDRSAAGVYRVDVRPAVMFRGRYLSLTSYRRDGTPIVTPVWFADENGAILVQTDAASGKVKRIRRNPSVRIALCTARGRLLGPQVAGTAALLAESETPGVERLIAAKYRLEMPVVTALWAVKRFLHLGRPRTRQVVLSITVS